MSWVWLAAAVTSEIVATLSMRASDSFRRRRWIAPVVGGYIVAFGFLALALQAGMAVGVAYGVWTAAGIALVALLARKIWSDPLTGRMVIGIGVVTIGVVLVEMGTH